MRLLFTETSRAKLAARSGSVLLAALLAALAGCASKNPLIDGAPQVAAQNEAKAATKSDTKPETKPEAAQASAATPAAGVPAANGAQVVAPTGIYRILNLVSPYRITIQQGNFVSQEMLAQLKEGMTREQVRFILGTPLLTDMFHEDRWDYPFRIQKPNGEIISSRVAVFFKNNTVQRFDGGNLPTEKDYLAHITNAKIGERTEIAPDAAKKKDGGK